MIHKFEKVRYLRVFAPLFVFLFLFSAAEASDGAIDISGYVARMILGLGFIALLGWAAVKYMPRHMAKSSDVKLIASYPLGKDALYVFRIGPDVVAIMSGRNGADLVGRWSVEDWESGRRRCADEPVAS